jgi:predicted phage tail protein
MKQVLLEGRLGEKFGREWELDVRTPAEALRAIEVNKKGFFRELIDSAEHGVGYRVLIGKRELEEETIREELNFPFGQKETFSLIPIVGGAGKGGVKFIIGLILVVAAVALVPVSGGQSLWGASALGPVTWGNMAAFGALLMVGGVAQMLSRTPSIEDANSPENRASYLFNGPVNTVAQGGPVPVGYGRLTIGSILISGGIIVNEIPISNE